MNRVFNKTKSKQIQRLMQTLIFNVALYPVEVMVHIRVQRRHRVATRGVRSLATYYPHHFILSSIQSHKWSSRVPFTRIFASITSSTKVSLSNRRVTLSAFVLRYQVDDGGLLDVGSEATVASPAGDCETKIEELRGVNVY